MALFDALDSDLDDVAARCTDDDAGVRRSMMWFLHRSKEELVRKRRYLEFIMKHFVAASMPQM